jgi:hypothetical protein
LKKAWIPRFFEFPEDKEKDPTKCHLKPLWSNRWRECLSRHPPPATHQETGY